MQPHRKHPCAPIAVFAFNRAEHLRRTLDALSANELATESDLTVFCDGPRNKEEESQTNAVRETARSVSGFKSLSIIAQDTNQGLAQSIIAGVSRIAEQHGKVIVVEDDLATSKYFLRYMNDGLDLYADNPRVASIHGWCFPHSVKDAPETFFLRGADCWGWGTWKRAWDVFEPDAGKLLRLLEQRKLLRTFDLEGAYDYVDMLRGYMQGKNNSWAIRWHASTFLADMYTLYPGRSLVQNFGHDGSGTHCGEDHSFDVTPTDAPVAVVGQPVAGNQLMRRAMKAFPTGGPYRLFRRNLRKKRKHLVKRIKQWLSPKSLEDK